MAYGDFKDLPRKTDSNKVLRNKAFNNSKNSKYDGYQLGLFYGKSSGDTVIHADKSAIKSEIVTNQELPEESYKPIIRK